MTGEEMALSALGRLEFHLVNDRTGVPIPNASVQLLRGEPPRVRIRFWLADDALDHVVNHRCYTATCSALD
jgi:hypothetical protein